MAHGHQATGPSEWFEATLDEVKAAIVAVRTGTTYDSERTDDFPMRPEQEDAVAQTAGYFLAHADDSTGAEVPVEREDALRQDVHDLPAGSRDGLEARPRAHLQACGAVAWRDDLLRHVDFEGWQFVDRNTPLEDATDLADGDDPLVWFASFQDLIGKNADGNVKAHNEAIHLIDWDCIVLDEYHFGAWRDGARDLYDPADTAIAEAEEPDEQVTEEDLGLTSRHYLYLSGTPFRAITNGEFTEDQIFNWTYVDEQRAKADWDPATGRTRTPTCRV